MALSNIIGVDDCPFEKSHRGDVRIVGTAFARTHLQGVLTGRVRRDGANATARITEMIGQSKYTQATQLVMLQGVAVAGFNVIDAHTLSRNLGLPVLIVARRQPRFHQIKSALERVPGGTRKWALIERLGAMQAVSGVFVQCVGLSLDEAQEVIRNSTLQGNIPEPLRAAHLIAGAMATGQSRGRT
jgi:uncharacterized protein